MQKNSKVYLVGGGVASLSAAFYLIYDGDLSGENITIFDAQKKFGGSLDAKTLEEGEGYIMRGIRMFEEKTFTCTFDLMNKVPSLTSPGKSLREEFIDFNKINKCNARSRLVKNNQILDSHPLKLSLEDKLNLITLLFQKESKLDDLEIKEYFTEKFFTSNFWYEFCTVFAFQPWHSLIEFRRYFIRFIQSFPVIDTLETIEIAPYNQYESLILPIISFLKDKGVNFKANTEVFNFDFKINNNQKQVKTIFLREGKINKKIAVGNNDFVISTIGSITTNSSCGTMTTPPKKNYKKQSPAWNFWKNITKDNPEFGRPTTFSTKINKSKWTSFTVTFQSPLFFDLVQKYIHKKVSSYGGVSLLDSNWFISIVTTYNPYYLNQPKNVNLLWGFGLGCNQEGNFVKKKMEDCTGTEILTELIHHLGFEKHLEEILKTSICIPCFTPFVTSQFLPRGKGDRPKVIPNNTHNIAFLGQYAEIPEDVVFTVEYSVRSAQIAVYSLLGIDKKLPPIYQGMHHLKVLWKAIRTIFR